MSTSMSTGGKPARCRLLELPAELRIMIYQHTQRKIVFKSSLFEELESRSPVISTRNGDHSPRFKQISIDDPCTMLRSTCSFIRREYQCFFKNLYPTVNIDLTWFRTAHQASFFWRLEDYVQDFKLPSKAIEMQLRTLTSIHLHFEVPSELYTYLFVSYFERLLDDFPQLKHLELSSTCDAKWFEAWRQRDGPNRKWNLVKISLAHRSRYKHLATTENLYISCDLSQSMPDSDTDSDDSDDDTDDSDDDSVDDTDDTQSDSDDDTDDDTDDTQSDTASEASEASSTSAEKVIFKATENDSPYAWEGLELEQIAP